MSPEVWCIVLAGGSGRRLEAVTASFEGFPVPKQYCAFGGERSLLQRTLDRVAPLVPERRTLVVVDASQLARARAQIADRPGVTLLSQPCDRGTAAGVLLALARLRAISPGAAFVLLPSDHAMEDERSFLKALRQGIGALLRGEESLILYGAQPDSSRTDYGWIVPGPPLLKPAAAHLRRVVGFVEKPPLALARSLFESGALWNTMILMGRVEALWQLYLQRLGEMVQFFVRAGSLPAEQRAGFLASNYPALSPRDFSRDLMTGAPKLAVHTWPSTMGWSDLGTPERLYKWLECSTLNAS